jgi:hypothetical protein
MDKEVIDDKPHTWVGAYLYSHERDENIFIGALRFPGENLTLGRKVASFVEIYGRAIPVEEIPQLEVTFDNLRINGQSIDKLTATAHYPDGVPDFANAVAREKSLVVHVGEKVADRQQRAIPLLP